jgi:hypothetical protein
MNSQYLGENATAIPVALPDEELMTEDAERSSILQPGARKVIDPCWYRDRFKTLANGSAEEGAGTISRTRLLD